MSTVETLIELGSTRDAPDPEQHRPPRTRRWERAAVLVAGVLLVGPATPPPALPVTIGPAVPAGGAVLTAGETLLVVDPPVMSAYDAAAPDGPARWRVSVGAAAGWSAEPAGDLLLVGERDQVGQVVATTARAADTGEVRWRRPDRVYAAGDGAVAATEVRSGIGPGRRIEGAVHGIDPATGRIRWSAPVPSTAVITVLPGTPARVLVVHDSGLARLHDVRSGAALGEGRLPAADYAPDNPYVLGERLVLRHPTPVGTVLTGYDLPGFARRWQHPVTARELEMRRCADLLCLHDGPTRWALHPDTGTPAWTWPDGGGWRTVPGVRRPGEPVVLLRPAADGDRQLVAVVGRDGPRVLGVLPAEVRQCRAMGARLVCRTAGRLTAWNLGPAGRT